MWEKALDPNNLIHVANALLLIAFAVRDILFLRILFVMGSLFAIGYYYAQAPPLWDAIVWTCVYILIHTYWIVRIIMERRPITLTPDEQALYGLAFRALDRYTFSILVGLGKWRDGEAGEYMFRQGEKVTELRVLITGRVSAWSDSQCIAQLGPGQMVGSTVILRGGITPVDIKIDEPCRYMVWDHSTINSWLERDASLRAEFVKIVNKDLSDKLLQLLARG